MVLTGCAGIADVILTFGIIFVIFCVLHWICPVVTAELQCQPAIIAGDLSLLPGRLGEEEVSTAPYSARETSRGTINSSMQACWSMILHSIEIDLVQSFICYAFQKVFSQCFAAELVRAIQSVFLDLRLVFFCPKRWCRGSACTPGTALELARRRMNNCLTCTKVNFSPFPRTVSALVSTTASV